MACIDISSNAGVKLYIAAQTNLPTDMAQTNWEGVAATSWVEVSQVANLGARGIARAIIEYKALDGIVCKQKGSTNYGTMSLTAADIPTDSGQALMTTAVNSSLNFPFKIEHDDAVTTTSDPTIEYFPGMVGSWQMAAAGDSDSIRERAAEIALNGYLYVARDAT
jgi:hypothetical protein